MTRILHVEDDMSQRSLLRITLAQLGGYEVDSAGDGFRAIELAGARRPDLVVLDVNLPGISGIDTLRALRELAGMREVPVIFLTATGDLLTHMELLWLGVLKVIQKPVRPYGLAREIKHALSGRTEEMDS
jgi:two-component system OmpR family response regulator